MHDLSLLTPENVEHSAKALAAIVKGVPGLYQAMYEAMRAVAIDPIVFRRRKANLERQTELVRSMIEHKEILENVSAVTAKSIVEAAMEEDRPELQKLWAGLMARLLTDPNAMITQKAISTVKQMEPMDALVLDILTDSMDPKGLAPDEIRETVKKHGINFENYDLIVDEARAHLFELGCATYGKGVDNVALTLPFRSSARLAATSKGLLIYTLTQPPKK
ncbi:hypothetical protein CSR02_04140 [Acetobacter pomorum]|uniref:DUF4393 domain-containing protein n=1 Tax=Acetobacter pomorum TaxID=65959 RepID=A0A2G4RE48_9PROT|nr:hypothetical protein [Acetobacter pomorum]PHY94844.1 hypothetical protein CSR02_04140 [Acetobacter pomorum]GBR51575.1 hypothetical protein AA11825_2017 [Acetobacter pomorum DSM 11825]